nr:hypothetical protein [Tanacetum cinerariifolium]
MHTARDDSLLGTMRFVSRHEDTQVYGAILPEAMTNQAMLDSVAYKTYYAIASGAETPKSKKSHKNLILPSHLRGKGLNVLTEVALSKVAQLKEGIKQSKKDFHISQASGFGTYEGTDTDDGDEDDDDKGGNDDDDETDSERTKSDKIKILDLNKSNKSSSEEHDEKEENVDERVHTPDDYELADEKDDNAKEKMDKDEEDDVTKELYKDVNVNLGDKDANMTKAEQNHYIDNKLGDVIQKAIQSHMAECKEEAQAEKKEHIDLIDTSMRSIIKEEVKAQLPRILPKAVSDFATPVIERSVIESLEATVLTKSSSQPKSNYDVAASLSKFKLTKILMDKMEENKSYLRADYKKELYDALFKSYNTDKDLFDTYVKEFSLKRGRDDKDKDQDLSVGSDRGTKRRKSKEPSHTVDDSEVRQNQEFDTRNNDEQPDDEAAPRRDCEVARAEKALASFDELMDTSFDFFTFVLNRVNIPHLIQELLVGPAFNLLKGTCKSLTEL